MGDPIPLAVAFAVGAVLAFVVGRATSRRAAPPALPAPARPEGAEAVHASGLYLLSLLQREGRLIDFLQEDLGAAGDAEIGAAARVVHQGCRKALREHLAIEPVLADAEGAAVQVPAGFDPARIRLVGNVTGSPPFKGALRHHGWVASRVTLSAPPTAVDPRVLAPAEVELP